MLHDEDGQAVSDLVNFSLDYDGIWRIFFF